jgi:hypothetical protein
MPVSEKINKLTLNRFSASGMWGIGIYFAENASYSTNYAFQTDGKKQFFLAKVLTGEDIFLASDSSLRLPPEKTGGANAANIQFAKTRYISPDLLPFFLPSFLPSLRLSFLPSFPPSLLPFFRPSMGLLSGTLLVPYSSAFRLIFFRYDSVSGNTGGSTVYILYTNHRAYPEWLITYTDK